MISLEKLTIMTPLQKLPKNVGDLGKIIVAKGFKKLPKVQKIAQSGHTAYSHEMASLTPPINIGHKNWPSCENSALTFLLFLKDENG